MHLYEAATGKPVAVILGPGKTPTVARVLRHLVEVIRARWPRVEIVIRGDSHYARPEAMAWLEHNRVRYIFGLAGLLDHVAALAEDTAVRRAEENADKVRSCGDFRYAARSWKGERRVIARIEATRQGSETRFVVTNLSGTQRRLCEVLYFGHGRAENPIKAHELHLAADRTACSKAAANEFRLLVHTAAYRLLPTLEGLPPKTSFWRDAQFDTRSRQEAAIGHLRRRRREKAAAAASPSSRSPPGSPNSSPDSRSRCRRATPTSKISPASRAAPVPCRRDNRGDVPPIELYFLHRQRRHQGPKTRNRRHPHARPIPNGKSSHE